MFIRRLATFTALALVVAACSDSAAVETTTTVAPTTTTTTLIPTTSSTEPAPTTSEATTTTTTEPDSDSTTTTEPAEETTTTTTRVDVTTTTTEPPADADPDLVPYAGLYRQPTVFDGFLDFQANGVIKAGTDPRDLTISGRWDFDPDTNEFTFSDFDFGDGCDGADGTYLRERAPGGGRRIILVDDPCEARVEFIVQTEADCMCFLYNVAEFVEEE